MTLDDIYFISFKEIFKKIENKNLLINRLYYFIDISEMEQNVSSIRFWCIYKCLKMKYPGLENSENITIGIMTRIGNFLEDKILALIEKIGFENLHYYHSSLFATILLRDEEDVKNLVNTIIDIYVVPIENSIIELGGA
jgi:hypothetical protein